MNYQLLRFQAGGKKTIQIRDVLEFVNQNIKGKDQFYDILLEIRNQWTNVLEVFRNNLQISLDSQQVDIKIISNDFPLEDYEIKLNKCNEELEVLKNGIKKDIQEIQKDKAIDIAFFYSQPLMKYGIKNSILPNDQQEVGYLEQLRKLQNKIKNELSIKGTNRFNMRRSTKIQIHVLTVQNLEKVLEKGVKFLHFATHGQKNYFKIESSSQIGLADKLNYLDLIRMIKKKPPQLIVFNVCLSHDIAQTIYKEFQKEQQRQNYKPIITLGYDYKVDNIECEYISQILYTEILKGEEFKKIDQYLFEELRKIKSQINLQRVKHKKSELRFQPSIFFNRFHEIMLFKPLKIKEIHKVVEIQKNISFVKNELKSEEKKLLYSFMKKILQEYQGAVNCFGELTSNFIQKCLSYLWERNRLQNKLIFDCKQLGYEIKNILQFRCKFVVELERSNIMERKKETFVSSNLNKIKKPKIIVVKNCDELLKYQIREFGNILSFFMKKFAPNILIVTSKQDFTKKITYNVQFTSFNAELKNTNASKLSSLQEGESFFQTVDIEKKSIQFEKSYVSYLRKFVKNANKQLISRIPLVNLFPPSLFLKQLAKPDLKMEQNMLKLEQNFSSAILYAQYKMKLFTLHVEKLEKERKQKKQQKQMDNDRLAEETKLIKIYADQILNKMHCIGGFVFLYFEYLGKKEKQYHQPKIRRSVHRLINLCLQIRLIRKRKHPNEEKNKSQEIMKQQRVYEFFPDPIIQDFYQFQIKMYQMIYLLHIESQFQSSEEVIVEIKDCLKKFDQKIVAQRAYTMKQMQKIWASFRKLHEDIKKNKEISFFKNKRYEDYFQQINSLKDSIQKSIESKSRLSQWGLFSIQDANFMLLPILEILKEEVMKQSLSESIFNDCIRIQKLQSCLQKFEFLQKVDQGVFETVNKQYSLIYIQAKMKLQRLKHLHKEYFQITGAIYSIGKFNTWIQMCQHYKLNELKIYLTQEKCRGLTLQQSGADFTS